MDSDSNHCGSLLTSPSIPSYLLPSILSYIPIPHLQYRLVSKAWDTAIKTLHSLSQCEECICHCSTAAELFVRIQELTIQLDSQQSPTLWMLYWDVKGGYEAPKLRDSMEYIQTHLLPFLDSLPSSLSCSINFATNTASFDLEIMPLLANWCLQHSSSPKYSFFFSAGSQSFETSDHFLSFLRSPGMRHVTRLDITNQSLYPSADQHPHLLSPLRDSDTVSNLRSLVISDSDFGAEEAECLIHSPYLTNLKELLFYYFLGYEGMEGPGRTIGFDTIICSPIMKNLQSFEMTGFHDLGYSITEAFAQSHYLKNLTHLTIDGFSQRPLEPLLRCDSTMPRLTSLALSHFRPMSEADMHVITSPMSALFNRLEYLDLGCSTITIPLMRIVCESDGLKSLKKLSLMYSHLTDESLRLLSSASPHRFSNLQHLDVSCNECVTNESVVALYSSKALQCLQRIDFIRCGAITVDALKEICAFPPHPCLRLLSFQHTIDNDERKRQAETDLKLVAPQLTIEL